MTNALHLLSLAAEVLGIGLLYHSLDALMVRAILIPVRIVIEEAGGLSILRIVSESAQGGISWARDIPGGLLLVGTADPNQDRRGRNYTRP